MKRWIGVIIFLSVMGLLCAYDEGFETGNFSAYPWSFGGNGNWTVSTTAPQEGTYCAQSGAISHNQSSQLILNIDVEANGVLSFFWKVSSEADYDFLRFYLNGTQQLEISGTVAWSFIEVPLATGSYELKWAYEKDVNTVAGSDAGWIDSITFPAPYVPPVIDLSVESFNLPLFHTWGGPIPMSVTVRNNGSQTINEYSVQIWDNMGHMFTLSDETTPLAYNQSRMVELVWLTEANTDRQTFILHGVVEVAGDEVSDNNSTPESYLEMVNTQYDATTVGTGVQNSAFIPMSLNHHTFMTQFIIFDDEIAYHGRLSQLSFYTEFATEVIQIPITIWLSETEVTDLSDGWIPAGDSTMVCEGLFSAHRGIGLFSFQLNNQIRYHGGNLLVTVFHPWFGTVYGANNQFLVDTDVGHPNRTRIAFSDQDILDPHQPAGGILSSQRPMFTIFQTPLTTGDLMGTVYGADNEIIPGAEITLSNGQTYTASSDADGRWLIEEIMPGAYNITISATGYSTHEVPNFAIAAGDYLTLDAYLSPVGYEDPNQVVPVTVLHQNHPNPFNPNTCIGFSLVARDHVQLAVFNVKGQKVATLVESELNAGHHEVVWDGQSDNGTTAASGVYFYRLATGDRVLTKKMLMMK